MARNNQNVASRKQLMFNAHEDVIGYDFTITANTKKGQKVTSTIPAGTPRKHLKDFFKIIGYPPFLYKGNS